ncbi:hypothetical protein ACHZ98_11075 [Streptomyces sp. MAR4 CNY-716]
MDVQGLPWLIVLSPRPREQTTAPLTVAAFSALGCHPPGRAAT